MPVTNPIERVNGEIKRRTNVVGIFPNAGAIVRLVGTILLEQTDEWAVARRYMTLETLAGTSDTAPISLPAIPAWSISARTEDRSPHTTPGDTTTPR